MFGSYVNMLYLCTRKPIQVYESGNNDTLALHEERTAIQVSAIGKGEEVNF